MQASGHCHFPAALPVGKEALLPTRQEDGWIPEPVWTFPCRNSNLRSSNPWPVLYTDVIPALFHARTYFHIKRLHPTLRLSQILRIENCIMVIQCTTRTGLFLYSPTSISATYILLTLCQRIAVSFTTLLPTGLVLPTEIMNVFLFFET